ncbi:unnamed protein product [Echinostoma caproni]|uniref:Myelin basic protein n=1 Tax=Echinostoma caproni TaxID=27848 RepID=A0A183AYB0_9TREM|nr:unnamed protein product [Echinostoma caproni]
MTTVNGQISLLNKETDDTPSKRANLTRFLLSPFRKLRRSRKPGAHTPSRFSGKRPDPDFDSDGRAGGGMCEEDDSCHRSEPLKVDTEQPGIRSGGSKHKRWVSSTSAALLDARRTLPPDTAYDSAQIPQTPAHQESEE